MASPPCYIDARSRQLSEESVLVGLLHENGAGAFQKLSGLLGDFADSCTGRTMSAVSEQKGILSTSEEKVMAALVPEPEQSAHEGRHSIL